MIIDFSARYDSMYLWDQNVMRKFVTELQNRVDYVGALQLHSLTLTGRFDF
ncbi:MAG: hypothetical protein ACM3JI_05590 [Anaerolineae bacterium]